MLLLVLLRMVMAVESTSAGGEISSFSNLVVDSVAEKAYFTSEKSERITINSLDLETGVEQLDICPEIPNASGGVLTPRNSILYCAQGSMKAASGIYELDMDSYKSRPVMVSWNGLQFNSPSDIVIRHGYVWFTDPEYGFDKGFRPFSSMGNWVWRGQVDFEAGGTVITNVRPIIGDMHRPSGISISSDNKYLYVTDVIDGEGHVLIFNLDSTDYLPYNRRVFAYIGDPLLGSLRIQNMKLYVGTSSDIRVYSLVDGRYMKPIKPLSPSPYFEIAQSKIYSYFGHALDFTYL